MSMRLEDAERIAAGLVRLLEPACERIEIAGSVRRKKPRVKDIEIVAIPRYEQRTIASDSQATLFGEVSVNLLDERIDRWLEGGAAQPRLAKDGRPALGPKYKRLVVDCSEDVGDYGWIPVDLFVVLPPAQWGLILMIRTGSGIGPDGFPDSGFGPAMLARWKEISGGGRSSDGLLRRQDGRPQYTLEEADVFSACKVTWVPPEERTDASVVRRNAYA